ncbi:YARHG domain-containing protein [Guptibacillus hwajinpoensis]|uniref:YARHG domain-containing protein n=1 Tax=Guptibacillus hwajinpoensis TaxID=208199 RepID=UPI00136A0163
MLFLPNAPYTVWGKSAVYVFKSDELESYFSEKNWYFPDPYYDGSLNNIEAYNVKLIEDLEELY